ncbi:hypothetical protein [Bifidobacterium platyrrhinorum]|uniref:Uncharacterized protein n=1 Tax=Bifidobacterium platyrrhinorum TaxID=2661628 RepID=A0A6L9SU58_9BIFI|nr:hypothetical protein [Bifidobacterium platyrrhinorum]NEG56120.1 hypothetical protein [Bifidobacterium platyrrhinorum]
MTQVHISIKKPLADGTLAGVAGVVRFRPVRRHFDTEKHLVVAEAFELTLDDKGEGTVDLLPTTPAFVWQVVELADTPLAFTRYVEVPSSQTQVEYADLVDVDPATGQPLAVADSPLVNWMLTGSQTSAEPLSAANPTKLVLYFADTTVSMAREVMESLDQLKAFAETNAATVAAMKTRAVSDAGVVSDAVASASMVGEHAASVRAEIDAKGSQAAVAIDEAVASVRDKAAQAGSDLDAVQDTTAATVED